MFIFLLISVFFNIVELNNKYISALLHTRLKAVISRREDVAKDRNARDHLSWTTGNVGLMREACIPHRIPRTWKQQG